MLIAIDIGNSLIHIGFFAGAGLFVRSIDTRPKLSSLKYRSLINGFIKEKNIDKTPEGIIISSVVPGLTDVLRKSIKKLTSVEPLILSSRIRTGLKFDIPKPWEIGADRIANSVAAYDLYKCPVAAIDFGTATTVSVVGKDANYIGGAIMPGIRLMSQSLAQGTSKLFEVPVVSLESAVGTDTVRCIQSGLLYGTAGAVERILSEIENETRYELKVVLTGGYGDLISKFLKRKHDLLPYLTLEGLRIIYLRNLNA